MPRRLMLIAVLAGTFAALLGSSGSAASKPPCWANSPKTWCLPTKTSSPTISGAAVQGQTLSADPGSWQGTAPIAFAYQWLRCDTTGANCASVPGATSQSYMLSSGNVGATIQVTVTATNGVGSSSAVSAATATVSSGSSSPSGTTPPSDTTPPSISGTAVVGQTLSASPGSWSGTTPMTYAYRWRHCDSSGSNCNDISGATSQTYTLGSNDAGAAEVVSVKASNSAGSSSADSAPTSIVATPPLDSTLPSISGSAQSGRTLTASPARWTGTTPISYGYQWLRCDSSGAGCASISGATSPSYVVASADVRSTLRANVTASNIAGSAVAQSPQTAAVAPASTTRDVYPGGSIVDAVNASSVGDTVVVHAGSYPRVTLTRQFSTPVNIVGAVGETVTVGGFDISGGAGYTISNLRTNGQSIMENAAHDITFDHVSCTLPSGTTAASCFYFHDSSHDGTISNSSAKGGWDAVKVYALYPVYASNIVVKDSDLSGATEDDFHIDGVQNMLIEHNFIHDPIDNSDHNDGIQSQRSDSLTITRNTFSFQSVAAGTGGPNNAMMVGIVPTLPGRITNTVISNNLVAHWNAGRPLIVSGTNTTTVVNNTFVDSGSGVTDPSITLNAQYASYGSDFQNNTVSIWNNIVNKIYIDAGATGPAFCDRNLVTNPQAGMSGTNVISADPQFVDRTTYALSSTSPARGVGLTRSGTPVIDIDGAARPTPLDLGARS
jgi:hypothetical protein